MHGKVLLSHSSENSGCIIIAFFWKLGVATKNTKSGIPGGSFFPILFAIIFARLVFPFPLRAGLAVLYVLTVYEFAFQTGEKKGGRSDVII